MSQTLKQFAAEVRAAIDEFEKDWIEKNKETPNEYPIEFETGNEGLWWEMFQEMELDE